ncbi:hypothetical protein Vadar_023130 [Vaccinium darrowii]|uniref:Uncharacterized protein n=1 Tax=Vaccinium darrowii TaxID=229202 RepID=A0ACB7Y1A2_9ERIC|nr:hypothetical protein Vadar_023130 [Vaccinium darrowii]
MEAGVWRNWQEATTKIASFMFACAMFQQFFPEFLRRYLETLKDKFVSYFFPCVQISFHEYSGSKHKISEAYSLIESYLSSKSPTHSKRIIGDLVKRRESVVLTMDASEEIVDVFDGVVVKWFLRVILPMSPTISWRPNDTEKKCYELTFHSKDRKVITSRYLDYVMSEGREIAVRNRQQRIYTNNPSDNWRGKKKENEIRDSDPVVRKLKEEEGQGGRESKVTLSGLLNFMDGLWSACAGERIVVVTTN